MSAETRTNERATIVQKKQKPLEFDPITFFSIADMMAAAAAAAAIAMDPADFESPDFDPSKWVDALCASRPEGESMEKCV